MENAFPSSAALFWDVDFQQLDPIKHRDFIIQRVFMRGDWPDYLWLKDRFSQDEIKNALKKARFLDKKTLHFASVIYDLPLSAFRCYTTKLSNREHWKY